jgi:hypothetical protein
MFAAVIFMFFIIIALTLMPHSMYPKIQELFTQLEYPIIGSNSYPYERGVYLALISENDALYQDAKMYASKLGISVEEGVD